MSKIGVPKVLLTTVGSMIKFTTISNLAVIKLVFIIIIIMVILLVMMVLVVFLVLLLVAFVMIIVIINFWGLNCPIVFNTLIKYEKRRVFRLSVFSKI